MFFVFFTVLTITLMMQKQQEEGEKNQTSNDGQNSYSFGTNQDNSPKLT